jgi:acyl-CoA synthetase (AMP-forming)/AMP-acid ligase II
MTAAFTHPLARDAKIWETSGSNGAPSRILVIITTLELEKAHKSYKADKVDRLAGAAKEWLQQHALAASDFVLINRPRDWR